MTELVKKLNNFFRKDIWYIDIRSLNRPRAFLIKTLRLIHAFVREQGTFDQPHIV